jgi:hypothetical protein
VGIKVHWHDEARRIWYQEVSGVWTVDDYWASVKVTHEAFDAAYPDPVYTVTVFRGPLYLPPGIMSALRSASGQVRPNERILVYVGGGLLARSIFKVRHLIDPNDHTALANTLDEALKLIDEVIAHDKTLPDIGPHNRPRR